MPSHAQLHRRVDEGEPGEGVQRAGVHPARRRSTPARRAHHGGIVVAHGHPLGMPGGARGVEDVGQIVGRSRHLEGTAILVADLLPAHDPGTEREPEVGPATEAEPWRWSWSSGWIGRIGADVDHHQELVVGHPTVLGHQLGIGHHGAGARMGQHVAHFGRGQARVHRHGHAAGPVDGGVGDQPVQRFLRVQMDPDPPIERQAGFDQAASQRVGLALPLGEGQVSDVHHREGGLTGELLGHPSQVLVHPHVCGIPQGARWRQMPKS